MDNKSSTKELKKVLSFTDLFSTAVGQIIGAGIMTLLGATIAMTGRSVPIAFLVAAVLVILSIIPVVIIAGTVRVRGGQYTMTALLCGEKFAGIFVLLFIASNIAIAMYGISFANYFIPFFGFGTTKVVALSVLTVFYILNFLGVDKMAKFQNLIVICMCIALGLFAAFGIGKVSPDYLTQDFLTDGLLGLMKASGILTFAVGGGSVIVNLSAESKNPTRDIPLAIIVSTLTVAVLYGFVSVVAAGVLPVPEVAGQPLNLVAERVLPKAVYVFFMVFGAMFALISTINAQFAWSTKPIMQACDDGWLPSKLAYLHPKYKTPVILLSIMYGLAVICILFGLDISVLGNISLIATNLLFLMINMYLWKLPKIAPDEWEHSKFKIPQSAMPVVVVLCSLAAALSVYLNAIQLSTGYIIGNGILIAVSYIFAVVRIKSGKVKMQISYEKD